MALALRELGASALDIRDFLDVLGEDRAEARRFLAAFLNQRLSLLGDRIRQIADTLALVEEAGPL